MKAYHFLFLIAVLGYACRMPAEPGEQDRKRSNILFILTDDQGVGDFSLFGNDSIQTPNLDALLQSGARFERFYVDPVCAPTRASFQTGLYAARTGTIYVTRRRETMALNAKTLAEHLRAAGYRTGLFGKWHNGATLPYSPAGRGFDKFQGFTSGHFNDYFTGILRNEMDEPIPFSGDLTDLLTDTAADWMTEKTSRPFFAMLAYQAPHTPVQVADDHWNAVASRGLTPFNTGVYAMVESVDEQVGKLLKALEAAGQLEETVVIFASDNGPNGDRFRRGLRGWKGQIDEGGVRAPFVIRFPGDNPANGSVFDTPAAHIDLLPTLLDYLDLPRADSVDGLSLMPLLRGEELPERYIYTFRQGYDFDPFFGSMRNERYLYVRRGKDRQELYDLKEDPEQTTDLSKQHVRLLTTMAATYEDFAAQVLCQACVAPPIELDAAKHIRMEAHEGEPRGGNTFAHEGGWANDYLPAISDDGVAWPVHTQQSGLYEARLRYHLSGAASARVRLSAGGNDSVSVVLQRSPPRPLPVADRLERKEAYPYDWAVSQPIELRIPAGTDQILLRGSGMKALWIKSLELTHISR